MTDKIEQLHNQIIKDIYLDSFDEGGHNEMDTEKAGKECSVITKDIAIKYANWRKEFYSKVEYGVEKNNYFKKYLTGTNQNDPVYDDYFTEEQLFNIFIETL